MKMNTMRSTLRIAAAVALSLLLAATFGCSNPLSESRQIRDDFLEEDSADLSINFSTGENAAAVMNDLGLPRDVNGTSVAWSSSEPGVIESDGTVHRPAHDSEDTSVTLTATLEYDGSTDRKVFEVTVKRLYAVTYVTHHTDVAGTPPAPQGADAQNRITLTDGSGAIVRDGYNFLGWTQDPQSDSADYDPTESITVGGDLTLYPFWANDSYLLAYDGNDGEYLGTATDVPSSTTAEYSDEVSVASQGSMARTGYSFSGWNTAADSTGDHYDPTDPGSNTFTIPAANTTLYAQWTPYEYSITYANQGGSHSNPSSYTIEDTPVTLSDATKTGYIFDAWYDANDNPVTEIPAGGTGAYSLEARWILEDYSISYNLDGGTNDASNPSGYSTEDPTITLADPTKTGYSFDGWYDSSSNRVEQIPTGSTQDLTLTARWSPIEYTVSYTLNGGQNSAQNPATYTIEDTPFTLSDPTKSGYVFDGWFDPNINRITQIPEGTTGPYELVAQWILEDYSISYNLDGGTNDPSNPNGYSTEDSTITLQAPTKSGYSFDGWYDSNDNRVDQIPSASTGDVTLTARWTPNEYSVTYQNLSGGIHSNPTSYTVEDTPLSLLEATRTGYLFEGWVDGAGDPISAIPDGSTGNVALTAQWTQEAYTVTYYLDGGTNHPDNPAGYSTEDPTITLEDPSKDGYAFTGWQDADGNTVTEIPGGSTGDIAMYARWEVTTYPVTYTMNGGQNDAQNPASYTIEHTPIVLADPTQSGYVFDGWYDTNGNSVTEIPAGGTGAYDLEARWTPIPYPITYNLNGGMNWYSNPDSYTVESSTITFADPYEWDGYIFDGWFDNDGNEVTEIPAGSMGEVVVNAQWTPIVYSITYQNLNGGTHTNPSTYTEADTTLHLEDAQRDGYRFENWLDENGESIPWISWSDLRDHTLTAQWSIIEYAVNYNLEGGTNHQDNPSSYTIEDPMITLQAPTKNGYVFNGWQDPYGSIVTDIADGSTGNISVTAQWTPEEYTIQYTDGGETWTDTYTIEDTPVALGGNYESGYTFDGWYDPDGNRITEIPEGSTQDYDLHAEWTVDVYELTYNLDGGTNHPDNPSNYTIEDTPFQLYEPTKDGYIFDKWEYDWVGRIVTLENDEIVDGAVWDLTLFARWLYDFSPVAKRDMVSVPGGTYIQAEIDGSSFEHTIGGFSIGKYEVTYDLWYRVHQWAIQNGYEFFSAGKEGSSGTEGAAPSTDGSQYQPVTEVSFTDAIIWSNAYSEMSGYTPVYYHSSDFNEPVKNYQLADIHNAYVDWSADGYRLPTEGEWQYAASYQDGANWTSPSSASGDSDAVDVSADLGDYAWYEANSGSTTHEVGTKAANQLGVHDMSGNVAEWCWDMFDFDYPTGPETDYVGPITDYYDSNQHMRVMRGGSWKSTDHLGVGERYDTFSMSVSNDLTHGGFGFRVVRDPQ